MDSRERLIADNQRWQQDDENWFSDIEQWQQETQQWIALLYLLEKNLPTQASDIEQHKADIQEHKAKLIQYQCGLDKQCLPTCPSHIPLSQLEKFHHDLGKVRVEVADKHAATLMAFNDKKQKLRALAERLLDVLSDD